MKKLTIAVVLALTISANVQARTIETCKTIEGFAEEIMKARQAGVSASEAYEAVQDSPILTPMVRAAYKLSAYNTEEYQEQAVSEFKDDWFIICMDEVE